MTANATPESAGGASGCHCHCQEPRLIAVETKVDNIGAQLNETKQRVDHIDERLKETKYRVDLIDERLKETQQSVNQLRTDNRELLRWGMAATTLMFGAIVSSYLLLTSKTDLSTAEASRAAVTLQKIADEVAAIKAISLAQSHEAPKR